MIDIYYCLQKAVATGPGDGGLSWLKQALRRCEQQVEEEGRSLDEVAAERYGVRAVCLCC